MTTKIIFVIAALLLAGATARAFMVSGSAIISSACILASSSNCILVNTSNNLLVM